MTQVTEADSGFTAQNITDAEALWADLPVFPQKWHTMQTYQRAAVCHAVQRFREQAVQEQRTVELALGASLAEVREAVAERDARIEALEAKLAKSTRLLSGLCGAYYSLSLSLSVATQTRLTPKALEVVVCPCSGVHQGDQQ